MNDKLFIAGIFNGTKRSFHKLGKGVKIHYSNSIDGKANKLAIVLSISTTYKSELASNAILFQQVAVEDDLKELQRALEDDVDEKYYFMFNFLATEIYNDIYCRIDRTPIKEHLSKKLNKSKTTRSK